MQDNEVKVGVNCEVKLTSEVHKKDGTSADVYIMRTDSAGKSTTELHHETLKVENQKVVLNWKVEESKLLTGKVEKMELEGACEKNTSVRGLQFGGH